MIKKYDLIFYGNRNFIAFYVSNDNKDKTLYYKFSDLKTTIEPYDIEKESEASPKTKIFIHEQDETVQKVYREYYGYKSFSGIITGFIDIVYNEERILNDVSDINNGLSLSESNFFILKDLISKNKGDILFEILRQILNLKINKDKKINLCFTLYF